jgi:hypothetical protein
MKRKVVVTIDCDDKYCEGCNIYRTFSDYCPAFNSTLRTGSYGFIRTPRCKRAEVKK